MQYFIYGKFGPNSEILFITSALGKQTALTVADELKRNGYHSLILLEN